ncbi:MAG TPA: hypothetical protein VNB06_17585, partial [Thermoanaerobaculia bacterium]|nr:hypothetical protein [Thermoanaerobaculia bacterium]
DLEPEPGSIFGGYDELTGDVAVQRQLGWRTSVDLRASRDLFFAFDPESSHFESDRLRGGLGFGLPGGLWLRFFAGMGEDQYIPPSSDIVHRIDDVSEWGAWLTWRIADRVGLSLGYALEEYDSDVERFDRDDDRLLFAVEISALGGRVTVR